MIPLILTVNDGLFLYYLVSNLLYLFLLVFAILLPVAGVLLSVLLGGVMRSVRHSP